MAEIKKINEEDVKIGVYRSPESGLEAVAQEPIIAKAFLESGMEFVRSLEEDKAIKEKAAQAEADKDAKIAELEAKLAAAEKAEAQAEADKTKTPKKAEK